MTVIPNQEMIAKIKEAEERGRRNMEDIKNAEIQHLEERRLEKED